MKLFAEAFLDKWEAFATKKAKRWEDKPAPKWMTLLSPDWYLPPTERYSLRLYLRQAAFTGLPVALLIVLIWLLPLAYSWWKYPFVYYDPRYHKVFIGLLSNEGYYAAPWMVLLLITVNCFLYLPRFYFWNRRAERLRREPPPLAVPAGSAAIDAGIWPPPPKIPNA